MKSTLGVGCLSWSGTAEVGCWNERRLLRSAIDGIAACAELLRLDAGQHITYKQPGQMVVPPSRNSPD